MHTIQDIIPPVDRAALLKELNKDRFVRKANNGNNDIYILNHHNAPHVMREIARLREVTFRAAGGGTGKAMDIDDYDTCEKPYTQLIVWNSEEQEIVGGYRYIKCGDALFKDGVPQLATTELFSFSKKFIDEYMSTTIELGRSFVQPKFQPSSENRKGLFSLDNLWDGLGALVVDNPDIKHFFGKVTMYTDFNKHARDIILAFMDTLFPDKDDLVSPIKPLGLHTDVTEFIAKLKGLDYKEAHKVLNQTVRSLGENIPPLVNAYMNLSPTMKTFGTAMNYHFGEVEETGILVSIADIYDTKKDRHIKTYQK